MHITTKCSVAVHCLLFIHEYSGQIKVTSQLLAMSTGSNPVIIRSILSALKKDGILSVKFGTGGASLACPPNEITLYRVYKAIKPDFLTKLMGIHCQPSPLCPIGRNIHGVLEASYSRVREDLCESMKRVTLEDVLEDYRQARERDACP